MKEPVIIAIAALGKETHYICVNDKLLWENPEDLKRVKKITLNHPLIMGRKTHESIGRPLPNRTNIILTRNQDYVADGCEVATTVDQALDIAKKSPGGDQIFIFGGAEIYELFLDKTDKLILTLVDSIKEGDREFPEFSDKFEMVEHHGGGVFDGEKYEWIDYVKKYS
jgi:dihydrofolate reductase